MRKEGKRSGWLANAILGAIVNGNEVYVSMITQNEPLLHFIGINEGNYQFIHLITKKKITYTHDELVEVAFNTVTGGTT